MYGVCPCQVLEKLNLSSSGDQVLGKCTAPGEPGVLITSLVMTTWFPGCTVRALSQVCHVSPLRSWSQAETLLADVNHPGCHEDVVSNWEPAHSLVENTSLWGWDCFLPSGSGCCVPVSLPPAVGWGGSCPQPASSPLVFAESFVLWVVQASHYSLLWNISLFLSLSLFFFSPLWLSHRLGCYLTLASSDCPQGIQAQSLP